MMKKIIVTIALVAAATFVPANELVFSSDFESPEFSPGNFPSGTEGWTVTNPTGSSVSIQTTTVAEGSQAVEMVPDSILNRDFVDIPALSGARIVWVDGSFAGTGTSTTPDFAALGDASAVIFFSDTDIQAFDGSGSLDGTGSFVTTGQSLSPSTFTRIVLRLDFGSQAEGGKSYDVYIGPVGGALTLTNSDLDFLNDVSQLNGFQTLAAATSFFDRFEVRTRTQFDANGDNSVNVGDSVAIVNAISGGAVTDTLAFREGNPILFWNANADLDGDVDTADLDALNNSLLGL